MASSFTSRWRKTLTRDVAPTPPAAAVPIVTLQVASDVVQRLSPRVHGLLSTHANAHTAPTTEYVTTDYASLLDGGGSQPSSPLPSTDFTPNTRPSQTLAPSPQLTANTPVESSPTLEGEICWTDSPAFTSSSVILLSHHEHEHEQDDAVNKLSKEQRAQAALESLYSVNVAEVSILPSLQPPKLQASLVLAYCHAWLVSSEELEVRARLNDTASDKHSLKVRLHQSMQRFSVDEKKCRQQLTMIDIAEEKIRSDLDKLAQRIARLNQERKKRNGISSISTPVSPLMTPHKRRGLAGSTPDPEANFLRHASSSVLREQRTQLCNSLESLIHTRNKQRTQLATISQSIEVLTQALFQTNTSVLRDKGGLMARIGSTLSSSTATTGLERGRFIDTSVLHETPAKIVKGFEFSDPSPGRSRISLEQRVSAPCTVSSSVNSSNVGSPVFRPHNAASFGAPPFIPHSSAFSAPSAESVRFVAAVDEWVLSSVARINKLRSNESKLESRLNKLVARREKVINYFQRIESRRQKETRSPSTSRFRIDSIDPRSQHKIAFGNTDESELYPSPPTSSSSSSSSLFSSLSLSSSSSSSPSSSILSFFERFGQRRSQLGDFETDPQDAAVTAFVFDHRHRQILHSLLSSIENAGLAVARSIEDRLIPSSLTVKELIAWLMQSEVVANRVNALELIDLLRRAALIRIVAREDQQPASTSTSPDERRIGGSSRFVLCSPTFSMRPGGSFSPVAAGSFASTELLPCVASIVRFGCNAADLSRSGWLHKLSAQRGAVRTSSASSSSSSSRLYFFGCDTDLRRLVYFESEKQAEPTRIYWVDTTKSSVQVLHSHQEAMQAVAKAGRSSSSSSREASVSKGSKKSSRANFTFHFEVAFHEAQHGEHALVLAASSEKERDEWIRVLSLAMSVTPPPPEMDESMMEKHNREIAKRPRSFSFESSSASGSASSSSPRTLSNSGDATVTPERSTSSFSSSSQYSPSSQPSPHAQLPVLPPLFGSSHDELIHPSTVALTQQEKKREQLKLSEFSVSRSRTQLVWQSAFSAMNLKCENDWGLIDILNDHELDELQPGEENFVEDEQSMDEHDLELLKEIEAEFDEREEDDVDEDEPVEDEEEQEDEEEEEDNEEEGRSGVINDGEQDEARSKENDDSALVLPLVLEEREEVEGAENPAVSAKMKKKLASSSASSLLSSPASPPAPTEDAELAEHRSRQRRLKVQRAINKVQKLITNDKHPIGQLFQSWSNAFRLLYTRALQIDSAPASSSTSSSTTPHSASTPSSSPSSLLSSPLFPRYLRLVIASAREDMESFIERLSGALQAHLEAIKTNTSVPSRPLETVEASQFLPGRPQWNMLLAPVQTSALAPASLPLFSASSPSTSSTSSSSASASPPPPSSPLDSAYLRVQLKRESDRDVAAIIACVQRVIARHAFSLVGHKILALYLLKHADADAELSARLTELSDLRFDAIGLSPQLILPGMRTSASSNVSSSVSSSTSSSSASSSSSAIPSNSSSNSSSAASSSASSAVSSTSVSQAASSASSPVLSSTPAPFTTTSLLKFSSPSSPSSLSASPSHLPPRALMISAGEDGDRINTVLDFGSPVKPSRSQQIECGNEGENQFRAESVSSSPTSSSSLLSPAFLTTASAPALTVAAPPSIGYRYALDELARLQSLPDPHDKLSCILKVSRNICKCVDEAHATETVVINADDLLLLFTYLICTLHDSAPSSLSSSPSPSSTSSPSEASRPHAWHAHLALMSDFLSIRDRSSLRGYYLSTAIAAIELVSTHEFTLAYSSATSSSTTSSSSDAATPSSSSALDLDAPDALNESFEEEASPSPMSTPYRPSSLMSNMQEELEVYDM